MGKEEITLEITDYCERGCRYCSSDSCKNKQEAEFMSLEIVKDKLNNKNFEHIIISGGEPLAHPNFYEIKKECEKHTDDVVVYSNAITHLIYNANVIDGVYLEANLSILPETDKIHLLRRVKQGREKDRPEVKLSTNFKSDCSCDHKVVKPDGNIYGPPCSKNKNGSDGDE